MAELWKRSRLFIIGIIVVTLATITLLLFARDERFDSSGIPINPMATIDPERPYELVVWEEEVIIPWAAKSQSETLTDAIRAFKQQRPNAVITYTITDATEARRKLAEAVAAGTPPDVYGTARGIVWHPRYQVPATPYLSPTTTDSGDEGPPLLPAATSMVTTKNTMWGWPKALWWHSAIGRIDGVPNGSRIVFDVLDIVFLEQWMAAEGTPFYTDAEGQLLWTEERLAQAATTLRTLQTKGALPDRMSRAIEAGRTRVESLLHGDADIIGPVGPHLAQAVLRYAPEQFQLMSFPEEGTGPQSGTPNEAIVLDVGAYFVFRHEAYEGDDHTRLASELAAFLAAYTEQWLVESLALIPVRSGGREVWEAAAPLDESSRALLRLAAAEHRPYALDGIVRRDAFRDAVVPHWHRFWDTSVLPEQFAADVVSALRRGTTVEDNGDGPANPESPTKSTD